jgi:FkbM family methyltransferase
MSAVQRDAAPVIVKPQPNRAGSCPRCAIAMDVIRLRAPGWRMAWEARCPECGHVYLQDLPHGHGLVYPASFDLDTAETFAAERSVWFSDWLGRGWTRPDAADVNVRDERRRDAPTVTLLNCLDPVYGHSVLKLLNVQREVRDGNCVVLTPGYLEHLVPDAVAEAWIVDEPPSRFGGWLLGLEEWLCAQLARFDEVRLARAYPHPHPSTFSLAELTEAFDAERFGDPSIVLALRPDRTWDDETANIGRLVEGIRARLPDAGFAIVGVGDPTAESGVTDLRTPAPGAAAERRWLSAYRGADLVVGVHGSHMLLPSGLAAASIELLPATRQDNFLQATLVAESDPTLALYRHRWIPGNATLSDVDPHLVTDVAVSLLKERDRFASLMTGPAAGQGEDPVTALAPTRPVVPSPPAAAGGRSMPSVRRAARRVLDARRRASADREHDKRVRDATLPAVMADARGIRIEVHDREELGHFLRHGGHFERDELDVCVRWLKPGMTAVDVGANLGAFTAAFAVAVGPSGVVHAFEPFAAARSRLERTLELNSLQKVRVHPVAVTDTEGSAQMYSYGPGYESWATLGGRTIEVGELTLEPAASGDVPTVTLDEWATAEGIASIDLLKIDVEGAEASVIRGAARLLAEHRIRVALVEVSDNTLANFGATSREVIRSLEAAGLRTFTAADGRLRPFRAAGHVPMANVFAASSDAIQRLRALGVAD